MNPLLDNAVMLQVQNGQVDAVSVLFERYKKVLYSFFVHMSHDRMLSEDLVQNVFVRVIRYSKQFKGEGSFRAWMFTIARNVLADHYRKGSRMKFEEANEQVEQIQSDDSPYESLIQDERKQLLHQAIGKLDHDKRELLILVKLQEMKYREVATMLDMNESTVKVKVFRAMKELQKILHTSNHSIK
ncbi:MAG: RNA polymerase sigma factor [Saprospiraceae bacterium]|nr:RNA polymerase sigma factor [Saprospiraceae bacterium]